MRKEEPDRSLNTKRQIIETLHKEWRGRFRSMYDQEEEREDGHE